MTLTARDLRQRRVDRAADAPQVDVEHALEALLRHRLEGRHAWRDAGVGDDHVEAAEALHGRGDRALHLRAVGDIGGEADRPRVVQLGRRALARRGVEVDDRHRRAAGDQRACRRQSRSRARPRDQRDLPVELEARHRTHSQTRPRRAGRPRRGPARATPARCLHVPRSSLMVRRCSERRGRADASPTFRGDWHSQPTVTPDLP